MALCFLSAAFATRIGVAQSEGWSHEVIGYQVEQPNLVAVMDNTGGPDGWDDLLVASTASSEAGWVGWDPNGNSFGTSYVQLLNDSGPGNGVLYPLKIVPGELDHDGHQDFILVSAGNDQVGWHSPILSQWNVMAYQHDSTSLCGPKDCALGDLNSDGLNDVVVITGDGGTGCASTLERYRNTGGGIFQHWDVLVSIDTGSNFSFEDVVAVDIDLDGDIDLVTSSGKISDAQHGFDREVVWFENDGTGTFSMREPMIARNNPLTTIVVADITGDGIPDVLAAEGGTIWLSHGLGGGAFEGYSELMNASGMSQVTVADMDGDSDPDIVGSAYEQVFWWENLGTYGFSDRQEIYDFNPYSVGQFVVHDYDRDGYTDIAVGLTRNPFFGPGRLAWLRNQLCQIDCNGNSVADCDELNSGAATDCNQNHTPDSCDIASGHSIDLNQDGVPDECQCLGDLNGDEVVDGADLTLLLGAWGTSNCGFNLAGAKSCQIDGQDLTVLLGRWGTCSN